MLLLLAGCGGSAPPPAEASRCDPDPAPVDCFLAVPGGSFVMGAQGHDPDADGYDPRAAPSEGPVRRVRVAPFWLQRVEATARTWSACVEAEACDPEHASTGGFSNQGVEARQEHAINGLSWDGAAALCTWLGGRLPTEAEWEWAARGAGGRRFPWGEEPRCNVRDQAVGSGAADEGPCRVRGTESFASASLVSPAGMAGMAGNVWEWTADSWEGGERRVQRGGGWSSPDPWEWRASVRVGVDPGVRLNDVGVRCAAGGARSASGCRR